MEKTKCFCCGSVNSKELKEFEAMLECLDCGAWFDDEKIITEMLKNG